jgi:hypothetical protein
VRGQGHALVAIAPVTDAGRIYLDELSKVGLMFLPFLLADDDSDVPPPMEQVVRQGRGIVMALDGPESTPAPGKVGYWTDGTRGLVAVVTERGRRLFFETERDVVRTNVLPYRCCLEGAVRIRVGRLGSAAGDRPAVDLRTAAGDIAAVTCS